MIYGRKQKQLSNNVNWDYVGCFYPDGNIDENHQFLFNHNQIERVYFIGYQDDEELEFHNILKTL
jgi:hypothetical protein